MLQRFRASVPFVVVVIVVAALLAFGPGRDAHAATLTVINTNDSGAGSLRQAIADAAPGDTIDFAPALSGQTITLTSGELGFGKNLTITGPAGGITVSGNHAWRVLEIGIGGALDISSLTIANGYGFPFGGGISNGGTLTLMNSAVSGNTTVGDFGGGISNFGTLNLMNSTVSGNSVIYLGGGIYNSGTVTVSNSSVSGNSTHYLGGGIYNEGQTFTLSNSTVSGNKTSGGGGGGGIYNYGGTFTLSNDTVSGNSASIGGGGIYNYGGTLTLSNNTISGNSASFSGGGIDNVDALTLMNSAVSGNSAGGDCDGTSTSLGYNLDSDGTCNLTAAGDLPDTDPLLDPLALNPPRNTQTHALQPGGPAIDHIPPGVNGCGTTVSTDQRGISRPQGSGCDIGAYELLAATARPNPTACSNSDAALRAAAAAKSRSNVRAAVRC